MLATLARYERDLELRRTKRQNVVGDILARRSVNANLQRTLPGTAYVNCRTAAFIIRAKLVLQHRRRS